MDFLPSNFSLHDVLKYDYTVNFVLGSSNSGKSTFLTKLIKSLIKSQDSSQGIYVLDSPTSHETNSLSAVEGVVSLNTDFRLTENCLKSLPLDSILIIDDFQLHSKVDEWQRVVNYCAHHFRLSIFLVVHSHFFSGGLFTALKYQACNLYLTYSNNSRSFLRSLCGARFLHFFNCNWKEGLSGYHVCFINTQHSFIINFVDCLLSKKFTTKHSVEILDMGDFDISDIASVKEKKFYITDRPVAKSKDSNEAQNSPEGNLESFFAEELSKVYTKKHIFARMFKIVRCLLSKNVISDNELILGRVNLFDFLSFTQRVSMKPSKRQKAKTSSSSDGDDEFDKQLSREPAALGFLYHRKSCRGKKQRKHKRNKKRSDKRLMKMCKKLKKIGVIIPISLIRNVKVRDIFS